MRALVRLAAAHTPLPELGAEILGAAEYVRLARECIGSKDLTLARHFHVHMKRIGSQQVFLGNLLIGMYAKCGSLAEAHSVLESMVIRDVISWTSLISGYSEQGKWEAALDLLRRMQQQGFHPNAHTFGSVFKACSSCLEALESGRQIHQLLLENELFPDDVFVWTAVLSMYGSYGRIAEARETFRGITHKNVVTWSAMLSAYVMALEKSRRTELRDEAIHIFRTLLSEGSVRPDKVMFISVLGICSELKLALVLHSCIREAGLGSDCSICHALIITYARCGSFELAERVFAGMVRRDVISWTSMIKATPGDESLVLFTRMLLEGVMPNKFTLAEALSSCCEAAPGSLALSTGNCIHSCIDELLGSEDVILGTALINVYSKLGLLGRAERIFDRMKQRNLVSWTAMITANAENGLHKKAVVIYRRMQLEGVIPNRVSLIAILTACSTSEFLHDGRLAHSFITEKGLEADAMVANALIGMYGRCGSLEEAREVFDRIKGPDIVSWSALLAAYAQAGSLENRRRSDEALFIFRRMQLEGVMPKKVTLVSVLSCCTDLSAGKGIHSRIVYQGFDTGDLIIGNAILSMYARCGALEKAEHEFREMQARDIVSWNGVITASSQHGLGNQALDFFHEMQQEGVDPDEVTMVSLIFACSHAGLVHRGCSYFASMSWDYGLVPRVEHYACLLDMLGRAGHLDEAQEFLSSCSSQAAVDPVLWTALLSSCKVHGDAGMGKAASGRILDILPRCSSAYVVLSHLYFHI